MSYVTQLYCLFNAFLNALFTLHGITVKKDNRRILNHKTKSPFILLDMFFFIVHILTCANYEKSRFLL